MAAISPSFPVEPELVPATLNVEIYYKGEKIPESEYDAYGLRIVRSSKTSDDENWERQRVQSGDDVVSSFYLYSWMLGCAVTVETPHDPGMELDRVEIDPDLEDGRDGEERPTRVYSLSTSEAGWYFRHQLYLGYYYYCYQLDDSDKGYSYAFMRKPGFLTVRFFFGKPGGGKHTVKTKPSDESGETSPENEEFENGSPCTIEATPKENCVFVKWVDDDDGTVVRNASHTFAVDRDYNWTAFFRESTGEILHGRKTREILCNSHGMVIFK